MGDSLVAIVGIIGGLGFTTFLFWNFFNLIKMWIERKSGGTNSKNLDPKFFAALSKFKKDTERRITNLEAIISDQELQTIETSKTASTAHHIKLESETKQAEEIEVDDSKLRNMLNE